MNDQTEKPRNQVSVLKDYLNSKQVTNAINDVLPKYLTIEKILSIALSEVRKTPKLLECDQVSFTNAIVECTQLGLLPGSLLGQAYLIPRNIKGNMTCTLLPGYRGYVVLAERAGTSLIAHAVFENDKYECMLGTMQKIIHIPADGKRGKLRCVYAVARTEKIDPKTGVIQVLSKIDHLTLEDIEKAKRCSQCPDKFWDPWRIEMSRKTGVRRLAKYLDLTPEFSQLCEIDDNFNNGITLNGVFNEEPETPLLPQNEKMKRQMKAKQSKNQETLL